MGKSKVIVQIISKDQGEYIEEFIKATQGFDRVWILDRCIDNSAEILTNLNEIFLENKEGTGFLASKVRDIGIDYILKNDYDIVVMFDGDRIPLNLSMELIEKEMNELDCSYALAEDDFRSGYNSRMFKSFYKASTAGLIVKTSFLRKIRKLSFMSNRCFHPDFDRKYGEEDTFFGACLYSLGAYTDYSLLKVKGKIPSGASYPVRKEDENVFSNLLKKIGLSFKEV